MMFAVASNETVAQTRLEKTTLHFGHSEFLLARLFKAMAHSEIANVEWWNVLAASTFLHARGKRRGKEFAPDACTEKMIWTFVYIVFFSIWGLEKLLVFVV